MKKKINLQQRIDKATQEIQYHQKELCLDLVYNNKYCVEYDINKLRLWSNYLHNTCMMHGIRFSKMLL